MLSFALLPILPHLLLPPPHPRTPTSQGQVRAGAAEPEQVHRVGLPPPGASWHGSLHSSRLGEHWPGSGEGVGMVSACCPIIPLVGVSRNGGAMDASDAAPLLGKELLFSPKPKPTSQLNPEKAGSICRPRDYIDLQCWYPGGPWLLLSRTWGSFNCHLRLSNEQSSPPPSPPSSTLSDCLSPLLCLH